MRISILFLLFAINSFSQDSIIFRYPVQPFTCPLESGKVVYSNIIEFDSTYSEELIYKNLKKSLPELFLKPQIEVKNIFEARGIDKQILSEDFESKTITATIIYKTLEIPDLKEIKGDIIVFTNATFIVKGNRMKIVLKDVEGYFTNAGLGALLGSSMSLLNLNLDALLKLKENNEVPLNRYEGKRTYTIDFYTKHIPDVIKLKVINSIKLMDF